MADKKQPKPKFEIKEMTNFAIVHSTSDSGIKSTSIQMLDKSKPDSDHFNPAINQVPKKSSPQNKAKAISFKHFLKPESHEILPFLIALMKNHSKAEDFAVMLFALQDLQLLHNNKVSQIRNLAQLYRSLSTTFGSSSLGTYEALRKNIARFDKADSTIELEIKALISKIKESGLIP